MTNIEEVRKCKHCGHDGGYEVKRKVKGTINIVFGLDDGEFADDYSNDFMYDSLIEIVPDKEKCYCNGCGKFLGWRFNYGRS